MPPQQLRAAHRGPVPAPPSAGNDDTACALDSIRQLVRGLRLAEHRTQSDAGLSAAQLFVLTQLATSSATSLSELAARTLTDRTSVAAVVERLEAAALVATSRDEDDRRRVLVRITPRGTERLRAVPVAPTEMLLSAMDRLEPATRRALSDSLGQLLEEMGLSNEPPGMLFEEPRRKEARR